MGRLSALRQVMTIAVPMMGMYVLQMGVETVSIVFVGQAGGGSERELAGLGMGNLVYNCMALSFGFGLTSSQDTLVSQAFGRGDFGLCTLYLHRCQICMLALFVICGSVLMFTEPLLILLRATDPETARHAGVYTRMTSLGLVATFQYSALRKFLSAQKLARPGFYVQCITAPLHCFWCAVLVHRYRVGGVGLALAIKGWTDFGFLACYASLVQPLPSCRRWWCVWRALRGVGRPLAGLAEYFKLAVPGIVMLICEWWAFEIMSLLVGYLRAPVQLAAHVSAANVSGVLYLVGTGTCKAMAALVGAATARGDKAEVNAALRAGLVWNFLMSATGGLVVVAGREQLAAAYSPNNSQVQEFIRVLCPFLAALGMLDGTTQCLQGSMYGFALQGRTSWISLICFWPFQLALAWLAGFHLGLGLPGVWLATVSASALSLALNTAVYSRVDFAAVVLAAEKRLNLDAVAMESPGEGLTASVGGISLPPGGATANGSLVEAGGGGGRPEAGVGHGESVVR